MRDIEEMLHEQRMLEAALAPRCRADFMRVAGMTPETFLNIATYGLPDVAFSQVKYEDEGAEFFTVEYRGAGYSQLHTLNFKTRTADAGTIMNERRDRSTGRHMFALTAVSGLYFGFQKLKLTAALEMGGYIWAKAGALIDFRDKAKISRAIRRRLAFIEDRLDQKTYTGVFGLAGLFRGQNLESIANLNQMLPDIGMTWDAMITHEKHPRAYDDFLFRTYRTAGYFPGNQMTVGQFLLCGLEYNAHVNLKRRGQMEKIERYTGVDIRALAARMRASYPRAGHP